MRWMKLEPIIQSEVSQKQKHQRLKRLPAMRETWVRSLGQEVPLEKEMATHSSILAWRIPRTEEPGGLQFTGSQRVGHDWATSLTQRVDGSFHPGQKRGTAIGNLILMEEEESTLCKRGIVVSLLEIRAWREFSHLWKEHGRSLGRGCSLLVAMSSRKSITLLLEAQLNCLLGLPHSHILLKYDYKS